MQNYFSDENRINDGIYNRSLQVIINCCFVYLVHIGETRKKFDIKLCTIIYNKIWWKADVN